MDMKVTFYDKLKELVDKDSALNNAIINSDYDKFKKVIESNPGTLNSRHDKLRQEVVVRKNLNLEEKANQFCIQSEIKFQAEKNNAKFYVSENSLHTNNPTQTLKDYLNDDKPSFKEPIIHYINQGADIKLLTKESLDKKLHDISFKGYGMSKIAESDKIVIIDYAKNYAIKTNNLEAYKHLEKEFGISDSIKEGKKQGEYELHFVEKNGSNDIKTYLDRMYSLQENKTTDISLKLDQADLNKQLDDALSYGKLDKIKPLIIAGADDKIITAEKLSKLEGGKFFEVITSVKEAIAEREINTKEITTKQNNNLISAVENKDALKAFSAIKNGADVTILEDKHYSNFDSELEKKKFNETLISAINENKLSGKDQSSNLSIN